MKKAAGIMGKNRNKDGVKGNLISRKDDVKDNLISRKDDVVKRINVKDDRMKKHYKDNMEMKNDAENNGHFSMFMAGFLIAAVISAAVFAYYGIKSTHAQSILHAAQLQTSQTSLQTSQASSAIIERTVPVLAVDDTETTGLVGHLTVREIPGNSNILVDINPLLQTDLQYSVDQAVTEAKAYTNYQGTDDLIYSYNISSDLLGGGSAGAATAIATIAALENKDIDPTVALTGTIDDQGNIGPVGGLLEKEQAAAAAGFKTLLIPKGQAIIIEYSAVTRQLPTAWGFTYTHTRYVPKSVDLVAEGKQLGIDVIEVETINDAVKYMLK